MGNQGAKEQYEEVKELGTGGSCRVAQVMHKQTKKQYALKQMTKSKETKQMYKTETSILKMLKHPNILELEASWEDKQKYNLLTHLYTGGELFDKVVQGTFSEKVAADLTRQMLSALVECHKNQVVHRDLKPENFVFETADKGAPMRLIDFGVARVAAPDEIILDCAGSQYYLAPEVLLNQTMYGATWKAADMWSVGVIIFLFVCGYPPFSGKTPEQGYAATRKGKYSFPKRKAGETQLSESVKDLISKCFIMDPHKRISAAEALAHPWVEGKDASEDVIPASVTDSLKQFQNASKLQAAVGRILSHDLLSVEERASIQALFKKYDTNGDGRLDAQEISRMMKELQWDSNVEGLLASIDNNGDGEIDLKEFESMQTAAKLQSASQDELKAAFNKFDLDGSGTVTPMELSQMCQAFMSEDAARDLVKEADKNGDGAINFDEWLAVMVGKAPAVKETPLLPEEQEEA